LALSFAIALSFMAGPVASSTAATSGSVPPYFFGFTPDFGGVDDATLHANYKRIKRAGARWVRFGIYWWFIERTKGNYTWYSTDRFFAAAACNRLVPLPMFLGAPQWASGRSYFIAPPQPAHFPEFKTMIRRVVARYGVGGSYWKEPHQCLNGKGRVPRWPARSWQVWNEPNIMTSWGDQAATARGYGKLLVAADSAINGSRNPDANTVLGGLTGSQSSNFLRALYRAVPRLNRHVDIFDQHAYAMTPRSALELLRELRRATRAHGAGGKRLWVSEVAWSSCRQPGSTYPSRCRSNPLAKDEQGQRRYLSRLYRLLLDHAKGLRLRRVAWYSWRDPEQSRATCDFCYGSGLFRRDGSLKPAGNAYMNLARSVR
jgi:hypothetical protein